MSDLTAIAEVGRRINSILDLDQLLNQVVSLIQTHFSYYHVQIFLVSRGSDRAYFKASSGYGLNEKWQREGRSLRIGQEGIIGWVAQHAEPLLANDVSAESRYIPDDPRSLPDTCAEVAVPLLVDDEVVGVLDVQSTQAGAFGEDDLFVLRTLADQVAVAVSSARAYEAQREEAWVTTVMLQVAEVSSQADGVQDVLDAAVRVTAMLAGVEACAIWLWDEDQKRFQYGASYGLAWDSLRQSNPSTGAAPDPPTRQEALRFPQGDWPALDRLHEARSPAVISLNNIFLPRVVRALFQGDTLALLPLLNIGRVFGVLGVSFITDRTPRINERRMALLGGIAQQVAAAADNSRLSAAREEEAWVSTVLLQVAEAVGRFQPLDTTLAQIAHIAPLLAGVDRCAILLREANCAFRVRQVYALQPGLAEAYQNAIVEPGDLPLLDDVCRLGQPMMVDDTACHKQVPPAWRRRFGSRSLLVVPLLLGDEVIGVLLADDVFSAHTFSPRRVRILAGIASQTTVAIENARLQAQETANVRLLHELELGHAIQRGLLPQAAPHIPGYQVVYRWRSAREVGGDFFDFIPLKSRELGVLIADVSDKGIPAALYMMFARTLLRSIAISGRAPAAMLSRANDLIVADSTTDMFVTTYYSILNYEAHTLTYASAGHNLALYAPACCRLQPMVTKGLALGIVAPVAMEQKTIALQAGDLVLFYTDGVTDALNPAGEAFGEERLAAVLADHHADSAEKIADAIDTALREFAGVSAQYDDITLVLLKREG